MKIFLPCFLFFTLLNACFSPGKVSSYYYPNCPPGTIEYANNTFVDKTEMTNFGWCEYMTFIEQVYGSNSIEFKKTLPDTLCWKRDSIPNDNTVFYLRHPAYRDYPVVGITYQQAIAYTKWRSDRVMEIVLVRKGIIAFDPVPNPDSLFTIEKYFEGKYLNYHPDANIKYYPQYGLPSKQEWQKISRFTDSLHKISINNIRKKHCTICFYSINSRDKKDISNPMGDIPEPGNCNKCYKPNIFHVKGNVRELSNAEGISLGGSWMDSLQVIMQKDTFHYTAPNAYTGFRNTCTWKKWEY